MTLSSEQQAELLREIREAHTSTFAPEWSNAEITWSRLGGIVDYSLTVRDKEGTGAKGGLPLSSQSYLNDLGTRLRAGMYRPGVGTWYTMTFRMAADGTDSVEFDYDSPIMTPTDEVLGRMEGVHSAEAYAADLAEYPRDPEHIPDWLRRKLDSLPNVYLDVQGVPGEQYVGEIGLSPGEVAQAFDGAGWEVESQGPNHEFEFSCDWGTLRTQTSPGLVRVSGKLEPEHWDALLAFLRDTGWRFGAMRYDGEKLVEQVNPE